ARSDCKEIVKIFRCCILVCDASGHLRFCAVIQKLAFRVRDPRGGAVGAASRAAPNRTIAGNAPSCISKLVRGAHGSSDQRGLGNGADVQIGGGVRVGDAFQAIVGSSLIAMWGRWFYVAISPARPS